MQNKAWIGVGVAGVAAVIAVLMLWPPATRFVLDTWQGDALREERQAITDPLTSDHWSAARAADKGVTIWDPINAERGFTLYTSGEGPIARLVTMTGAPVHEWTIPYSRAWTPEKAAVKEPQPDDLVFLRDARVLPNGDLIAVFEAAGHLPAGYGMVKVDKDSRPVWSYLERAHGGFDMTPDGRVLVLVQSIQQDSRPSSTIETPYLEDFLVLLSPAGKELAKISLVEALERSRFASLLDNAPPDEHDPLGATSVQYLGGNPVKGAPDSAGERVLLSFGMLDAVAILDVPSRKIVWAKRGEWQSQHEARALPDGDLMIADAPADNESRVQQIDLSTGTVIWSYGGGTDEPFASATGLSARRLANGNTLLTESEGGRLVEVDGTGTVLWEYTNPVRGGPADYYIPVVAAAQRIDARSLDASFIGFKRP
ncbi:arylsulfotransferase family protein [Emcibacter sp. SYSU 3D8]|uniref:arylsulfotransferase family protein n=1 Tax=Emcibacter sp. SYSU 3D8 TaxID=3133969 RepID=UPI0031FEF085